MNDKIKGYILGAVAAASYGMNPLFALPLYERGMTPDSVLFFRYLFAIPILGIMLRSRGRNFRITRKDILPLVIYGILFALSSVTLFRSYSYMDAGIASTILFVYPILVALIMFIVFREKISWQTIFCIAMAMVGIGLLFKSSDGATLSITGTLFVIGSALSYAIYIVGINHCRLKEMATLKVTFYVLLFGWIFITLSSLAAGGIQLPASPFMWLCTFMLGLLPTAISLFCTTSAIKYIGATPAAILGALEPVTAVFFGVTIFGEVITAREYFGLVLVIVAVTMVVAGGGVGSLLVRIRKMFPRLNMGRKSRG